MKFKKVSFEKLFFVVVGMVKIYVWFKVWFNFMFIKKHFKNVWLKIMVLFDIGNKIVILNFNFIKINFTTNTIL